MIATVLGRPSRATILLAMGLAFAGCKDDGADAPLPPETAAPAPAPTVTPQEDRGQKKAAEAAAADDGAFTNVDSGEAERAASQRGHESAGEKAPGSP